MTRKQPMNATKLQLPAMVFACILVGPVAWQAALAESPTATDDLDVQVEFAAGLTLVCGTLNFGTITVELGGRAGGNTVAVDGEGGTAITGSGNIALGGDASAAECKITGINDANTKITATIVGGLPNPFNLIGGGSDAPDTNYPGNLGVSLSGFGDNKTEQLAVVWLGADLEVYRGDAVTEHSFFIGGQLSIPADDFESVHMGTYVNAVAITVTEEDV